LLLGAGFDIDRRIDSWGGSFAFGFEANSVPAGLADILVGDNSRKLGVMVAA
jgi:hypothetical protein